MSAPDDIESAFPGSRVLAFPRAAPAAAAEETSSQMGGSDFPAGDGGDGGGDVPPAPPGEEPHDKELNLSLALLPMTDLGNAERFYERNRDRLRFCPALGWLCWDGRRWKRDGADEFVKRAEHETVRAIQDEAAALQASPLDELIVPPTPKKEGVWRSEKLAKHGRASESANRMASISNRACAMLAVEVEELDADPMKINVRNGTLVIDKTVDGYLVLRPHDPADLITKVARVDYDPAAIAPLYDAFLEKVQPPRETEARAMQAFLHQWMGYSLTGDTGEQKVSFHYGKGRNGKGVFFNIGGYIAGDYAGSIPIESFLDSGRARASGQATPDIAGTVGVRLLTTSEPRKGATLDDAFVKLFAGGDPIKARHLNHDYFEFRPQGKLTMQGNYRPKVPGTDEGIWNRLLLVPWPVFLRPEERDPRLFEKLKAEASGILNRYLDGLRSWLEKGLVIPTEVSQATAEYRADSDPLSRFLEACTRPTIGKRESAADMHALFLAWGKANGEAEWSAKGFAAAMKERGIHSIKSSTMYWADIEITARVGDFVDHEGKPLRGQGAAREPQPVEPADLPEPRGEDEVF